MGWFSKSKKSEGKSEPEAGQSPVSDLQGELGRLQALHAESLTQQAQLQASADVARRDRDTVLAELNQKVPGLEATLSETRQKLELLDEANLTMAEMIRERDQKIEELQTAANQSQQFETLIAQKDQKFEALEAELAASARQGSTQMASLAQQLTAANESSSSKILELEKRLAGETEQAAIRIADLERQVRSQQVAATRVLDLEKLVADESSSAVSRIAQLERQLAESEARSANRAEQRSALLRNMAEIHRLSATSSKVESPNDSLKLVNSDWSVKTSEEGDASKLDASKLDASTSSPFFGRSSAWNEQGDSESA